MVKYDQQRWGSGPQGHVKAAPCPLTSWSLYRPGRHSASHHNELADRYSFSIGNKENVSPSIWKERPVQITFVNKPHYTCTYKHSQEKTYTNEPATKTPHEKCVLFKNKKQKCIMFLTILILNFHGSLTVSSSYIHAISPPPNIFPSMTL